MFLLNMGFRMWSSGKLSSIILMNILPIFVLTCMSKGGLYQMMFRFLFRFCYFLLFTGGLYFSSCLNPLLFNACWYMGIASLNIVSSEESNDSLLLIPSGTALNIDGGWLLLVLM